MRSKLTLRSALSAVALLAFTACSVDNVAAPAVVDSVLVPAGVVAPASGAWNRTPTVTIAAPAQDLTSREGDAVAFSGSAVDYRGTTLTGSALVWKSSRDGQIGTGQSVVGGSLSVGSHIITLTATDSRANVGSTTRSVTVAPNQAPTATISAPANNISVVQGVAVTFNGTGTDPEDGAVPDAAMHWNSSADGLLGTGRSVTRSNLSIGVHTITLSVADSRGLTASSTRSLTVTAPATNQAPTGWISAPAQSAASAQGVAVSFTGSASDPEDGVLSGASIVWRSNINGQIGTGTSFTKSNLSTGAHTITMTSTDSRGASFAHNRSITITAATSANQSPTASMSAPGSGASFVQGVSVSFAGSATDPESGALSGASLVWTSSRDGQIGTGTSFSRSTLTVGTHTITLTARDPQGAAGTITRNITVSATSTNQPPVANFTSSCVLLACSFNASSSSDNTGVTQYSWNFGNGATTAVAVPLVSYTYLVAGTMNVTLTVRDAAGLTNSITKVVSVTSGSTSGGGSAEPTGMTKVAENNFDCVSACGNGWYFSQGYANAGVVAQDGAAPRSGANVGQMNYTPSLSGGSSPATVGTGISPKQTLYTAVWMKMSSNYYGHPSNVNKVIHFYTNNSNKAIFTIRGAGMGTLVPAFGVQGLAAPYEWYSGSTRVFETVANLEPNVATCTVVRGQWHKYEMVVTNNTAGVADGKLELWMDGVKCLNYTGLMFVGSGQPNKWQELGWSPTYGGGATTISTSFFTQVDHIYASGK